MTTRADDPRTLLVLLAGVPALVGAALVSGAAESAVVTTALVNLVLVVGLYTFVGNSGVLSFGHVAFAALGAYSAGLLVIPVETKAVLQPDLPGLLANAHLAPLPATLAGAGVAALVAAVVALPLMRLSGLAASISTFSVLVIVHVVAGNLTAVTGGAAGLAGVPTSTTLITALLWALVVIAVAFAFQRTMVGLRLRASREDEFAARALGVPITRERSFAWVVSAAVMGAGGALLAQQLGTFSPAAFYLDLTFITLAMLVVGGMTSVSGAVVGTIAITAIGEAARQLEAGIAPLGLPIVVPAGFREVALAVVVLGILVLRPRGITAGRELLPPRFLVKPRPALSTNAPPPTTSPGDLRGKRP